MFLRISSVQSLSRVQLFVTPWTIPCPASLSITNFRSLLKLMSIESVMPSNHLILCRPLLLSPQSFPASGFFQMSQLFASGGQSIGVSASTSILTMNTQDWFPLGWMDWFLRRAIVKSWLCDRHFIHQLCTHYLLIIAVLWGIYCFLVLQMKKLRLKRLICQNSYSL